MRGSVAHPGASGRSSSNGPSPTNRLAMSAPTGADSRWNSSGPGWTPNCRNAVGSTAEMAVAGRPSIGIAVSVPADGRRPPTPARPVPRWPRGRTPSCSSTAAVRARRTGTWRSPRRRPGWRRTGTRWTLEHRLGARATHPARGAVTRERTSLPGARRRHRGR